VADAAEVSFETFGGRKASGIGRRNGHSGFDQYLDTKSAAWPTVV
jgi:acyl-CoA reductase-like NAD-dependent aldehyde dehydrogenase